jgi:ketosteroid isomerase-like protein
MRLRSTLVAFALTTTSIASAGAAAGPPTDQWNERWAEADAPALGALYTDDARVMTPNVPAVVGRQEIQAMFARMVGRKMTITSTVVEDFENGDIWVRRTDYEMLFDGQHIDDGEAVELWRKIEDRWLLHLQVFTSRNIRPIAYDDPAPEYDNFRFVPPPPPASEPGDSSQPAGSAAQDDDEPANAEESPPSR